MSYSLEVFSLQKSVYLSKSHTILTGIHNLRALVFKWIPKDILAKRQNASKLTPQLVLFCPLWMERQSVSKMRICYQCECTAPKLYSAVVTSARTCRSHNLGGQKSIAKKHTPEVCAMLKHSSIKMGVVGISFQYWCVKVFLLADQCQVIVYLSPGQRRLKTIWT